ncbi:MAG: GtrA family protein [Candidatus Paceibacterota bacterium]
MKQRLTAGLWQTMKFIFVGLLNTGIDFLVFNLLAYYVIGLGSPTAYFFCKSIAFLAAMTNSFFFNSRFTFKKHDQKKGLWWRFTLITVSTFLISSLISTLAFNGIVDHTSLSAILAGNISVVISVAVGMFINFIGYKFFVFQNHE